jgi:hypothetical protein
LKALGREMRTALLLLLLPAIASAAAGRTGGGPAGISEYNWGEKTGGVRYNVQREGQVGFTADDSDISSLTKNGRLQIQEIRGDHVTVFTVRRQGDAPALQRSFSVDGQPKGAEEERAWRAQTLPEILRRTGLGAAERVSRLHEGGDVAAVLAEVRSLHSDSVKALYIEELVNRGHLSTADLRQALAVSSAAISSGYQRAELLHHTAAAFLADPQLAAAYFVQVNRVPTPFRGDLYTQIATETSLDDPVVRAAYQDALRQASRGGAGER